MIVAAGLGVRYGGRVPKAALKLTGKALVARSVEAMAAGGCTHAVVVVNAKNSRRLRSALAGSTIPVTTTMGGETRQESVFNGLRAIRDSQDLKHARVVLIQDAVRPMVPARVVADVIRAVEEGASAVAPALVVTDSMRMLNTEGGSTMIDRSRLRAVQTPQGFPLNAILDAHEKMADSDDEFTDDLTCAERAGYPVTLVDGSRLSMKITERADLVVARALWRARGSLGHHSGPRRRRRRDQ